MSSKPSFLAELKRRNVLRAGALYIGAAWALSQGVAQLLPVFDIPNWVVRWFVIAAVIGFPFAMLFSWFYEWTPQGIQRESDVEQDDSVTRATGKTMDRWIIAVLSVAVVLLLTNQFVVHREAAPAAATPTAGGASSIAVLPLVNESGDKDQLYFSDGLSEDLINALSQFDGLKVIGRTSSFQFRDSKDDARTIGSKLGVATLLEGTVERAGDTVRINAALVSAADGHTLWSNRYDRPYKDLFKLQDEITQSVAGVLRTRLLAGASTQGDRPPSGNLEAYDAFLHGRDLAERRTREDYDAAVALFQHAVQLDPDYAQAFARWAIADQWMADWGLVSLGERAAAGAQARTHARKAVALDPNLAEAQAALGITQAWSDLDVQASVATLRKAMALDPENPEILYQAADVISCLGHFEESIALIRKAITRDGMNANLHFYLAQYLLPEGRLDEAQAEAQRAIDLQPHAAGHHWLLARILLKRGEPDAALAAVQPEADAGRRDMILATAAWMKGDRAASDAALARLIQDKADVLPAQIGEIYALRGETDKAFEWFDRAIHDREPNVTEIYESVFLGAQIRTDPRFTAVTRQLGLPDPSTVPQP
jgi:TolB-like protein/Flp pilus assembly protein TadD